MSAFARRYGFDPAHPVQWEVEALPPEELQRLVLAAVDPYVDPYVDRDVLARQVAREEEQRRALAAFRWALNRRRLAAGRSVRNYAQPIRHRRAP